MGVVLPARISLPACVRCAARECCWPLPDWTMHAEPCPLAALQDPAEVGGREVDDGGMTVGAGPIPSDVPASSQHLPAGGSGSGGPAQASSLGQGTYSAGGLGGAAAVGDVAGASPSVVVATPQQPSCAIAPQVPPGQRSPANEDSAIGDAMAGPGDTSGGSRGGSAALPVGRSADGPMGRWSGQDAMAAQGPGASFLPPSQMAQHCGIMGGDSGMAGTLGAGASPALVPAGAGRLGQLASGGMHSGPLMHAYACDAAGAAALPHGGGMAGLALVQPTKPLAAQSQGTRIGVPPVPAHSGAAGPHAGVAAPPSGGAQGIMGAANQVPTLLQTHAHLWSLMQPTLQQASTATGAAVQGAHPRGFMPPRRLPAEQHGVRPAPFAPRANGSGPGTVLNTFKLPPVEFQHYGVGGPSLPLAAQLLLREAAHMRHACTSILKYVHHVDSTPAWGVLFFGHAHMHVPFNFTCIQSHPCRASAPHRMTRLGPRLGPLRC